MCNIIYKCKKWYKTIHKIRFDNKIFSQKFFFQENLFYKKMPTRLFFKLKFFSYKNFLQKKYV